MIVHDRCLQPYSVIISNENLDGGDGKITKMIHRSPNQVLVAFFLDLASIVLAVFLSTWMRLNLLVGIPLPDVPWQAALLWEALLVYALVFLTLSVYLPDRVLRRSDEFVLLARACLLAGLALAGLIYFTVRDLSRLYLVYFLGVHLVLVFAWRIIGLQWSRVSRLVSGQPRQVLLIGGGSAAQRVIDKIDGQHWEGFHLVGYLTDGEPITNSPTHVRLLGTLKDAARVVEQQHIDDVLIALPAEAYAHVQGLLTDLLDQPCNIWVVPDYFSLLIYGGAVRDLGGVALISLKAPTLTDAQRSVKRLFDLVVGSISLLLSLPIWAVVAIAIKLDSPGPVLLKQRRIGENGKTFGMYKFRSMVVDAEQRVGEVLSTDLDGNLQYKRPGDPRVTRIGRFIRRASMDELPQLLNVLRGEMSMVGPRPELPMFVAEYQPWQQKRFAVPQGITGWWQVNGRGDKPMHLNTEYDLYYVQNYSILLDIYILLRTIGVVLRGRGAF